MGFFESLNLNTTKDILIDNTNPSIKSIGGLSNINNINNMLSLVHLKRACCLRESSNTDEYELNIRLPSDNEYGYNLVSYKFDNLIKSCKNLPIGINDEIGDFNSGTKNDENYNDNCDNFYKTYCKTMRLLHDLNDNKYSTNKNLYRDHILYGEDTGLECGCLNSPLYYTNNRSIPDDVLKLVDFNCNDAGYKTKEMQSNITTYTNCSVNVGTGIDANLVNINNVQINNDCGSKQSNTKIDQSNKGINSNLSTIDTSDDFDITNKQNNNKSQKIQEQLKKSINKEKETQKETQKEKETQKDNIKKEEKDNIKKEEKETEKEENNNNIIKGIIVGIIVIIIIIIIYNILRSNNNTSGGYNNIIYQYYNNKIGDLYKLN